MALISFGPWGGPGGSDPFSFRVGGRINEIIVHHGTNITTLAGLSFRDSNGIEYGRFGANDRSDVGQSTRIVFTGNSERLTSITGTHGNYRGMELIRSLSFITNTATYGPYGTVVGTSFSLPIRGSVVINGFHGRSGNYLDAIGVFLVPDTTN